MSIENSYSNFLKSKSELTGALSEEKVLDVARQQFLTGLVNSLSRQVDAFKRTYQSASLTSKEKFIWQQRVEKAEEERRVLSEDVERKLGYALRLAEDNALRETLLAPRKKKSGHKKESGLLHEESERLDETLSILDDQLNLGRQSVAGLMSQNAALKSVRKKVTSALISAGVSSSIINSINSRQHADSWIVFFGIILVSLLLYLFFCWWTGIRVFWFIPTFITSILSRLLSPRKSIA